MAYWIEAIPYVDPVPPCAGWLAHNTKACDCYAEARDAAFRAELDGIGRAHWFAYPAAALVLLCAVAGLMA